MGRLGWAAIGVTALVACGEPTAVPRRTFAPSVKHELSIQVSGSGEVRADEPSFSCRTNCVNSFDSTQQLQLIPVADQGWTFSGWSGVCAGTDACDVPMAADATVTATFVRAMPAECLGLVPSDLPTAVTRSIADATSTGGFCAGATSDGMGNVIAVHGGGGPGAWTVWSSAGSAIATMSGGTRAVPQPTGFHTLDLLEAVVNVWSPEGTGFAILNEFGPGADPTYRGFAPAIFPAVTGGSVTVQEGCAGENWTGSGIELSRLDVAGKLIGRTDIYGVGCADGAWVALSDAQNRILFVLLPREEPYSPSPYPQTQRAHVYASWFGSDGTALTDWFDAGTAPQTGTDQTALLRPLIGGGAALSIGGKWFATFESGQAAVEGPPAFLLDGEDLAIVEGGKAYALIPSTASNAISIVSNAGTSCGAVQLPANATLSVGRDGTVLGLAGEDGCELTWWPQLLK